MIVVEPGASIRNLGAEMVFASWNVASAYQLYAGLPHVRLTSGTDGDHGPASRHYSGDACDYGTHEVRREDLPFLVEGLAFRLGPGFDVVLEDQGGPNEHLHVEFDPKRPDRKPARPRAERVPF